MKKIGLTLFLTVTLVAAAMGPAAWAAEFHGLGYTAPADFDREEHVDTDPYFERMGWSYTATGFVSITYAWDTDISPLGTNVTGTFPGLGDLPVYRLERTNYDRSVVEHFIVVEGGHFTVSMIPPKSSALASIYNELMNSLLKNDLTPPSGGTPGGAAQVSPQWLHFTMAGQQVEVGEIKNILVTFKPDNTTEFGLVWDAYPPGLIQVTKQSSTYHVKGISRGSSILAFTSTANPLVTNFIEVTVIGGSNPPQEEEGGGGCDALRFGALAVLALAGLAARKKL